MEMNSSTIPHTNFILPIDLSSKFSFLNSFYFNEEAYEIHKDEILNKTYTNKYDISDKILSLKSNGKNNISNVESKTNEEEILKKEVFHLEKSHTNTYKANINLTKTGTFDLDLSKRKTSKFSFSILYSRN